MKDVLQDLDGHRLKTLINVEANKARIGQWYDKKVKIKTFAQGELLWKLILPIGTKSSKFGKWSPTWEGPFKISRCVSGNAYCDTSGACVLKSRGIHSNQILGRVWKFTSTRKGQIKVKAHNWKYNEGIKGLKTYLKSY